MVTRTSSISGPSEYELAPLREGTDLILYRARHHGNPSPVLVLALTAFWKPHSRLVLYWEITADGQHDPNLKTELELRFIADGKNVTRVELEHRRLDLYGARRDEMRRIFDTEGDWGRLLEAFAQTARAASA